MLPLKHVEQVRITLSEVGSEMIYWKNYPKNLIFLTTSELLKLQLKLCRAKKLNKYK